MGEPENDVVFTEIREAVTKGEKEIERLNKFGAEIVRVRYDEYTKWPQGGLVKEYSYIDADGFKVILKDFSPTTDHNHMALVEQAMVEKGWTVNTYCRKEKVIVEMYYNELSQYTYIDPLLVEAPINQKPLAFMRCAEKALRVRKVINLSATVAELVSNEGSA